VADPRGFLTYPREDSPKRPVEVRRTDWAEIYAPVTDPDVEAETRRQAARWVMRELSTAMRMYGYR